MSLNGLGIDDNFFDVGGHSLTGMQIINSVNLKFHIKTNFTMVFGLPTIRLFSQQIKEQLNQIQ